MIGRLPQHSVYAFTKFLPGRIGMQAAFQQPVTGGVEKAKQYPPLAQHVQKVTTSPMHGLADRLSPGRRLVPSSRFHSQFKSEVVSAKTLESKRPGDRASEVGSTHYFKQTEPYPYEGYLFSPSLVQAQQKKFLSRKMTNEPGPGASYSEAKHAGLVWPSQRAATALALEEKKVDGFAVASSTSAQLVVDDKSAMSGKKHASIFLAEKIYRESVAKAMQVLMSTEKEVQSTEKDLTVVGNSIHFNDEEKSKIKHALYAGHVAPLVNDAKKQILQLSEKVDDFFDRHDFSDGEKSKAVAFRRTAKFLLGEKLAGVEKLGLRTWDGGHTFGQGTKVLNGV